jgi:hypothetical protein
LDSGGRLSIEASKGSLQLTAWDREEVEVHARIEAPQNVSADYARRAVEATRIDVSGSGSSVRIEPDYSDVPYRGDRWNDNSRSIPFIHFEISAPRRIQLVAESDRGPATISGFEGDLDIETDRGEAMLRDLSGRIQIVIDRGDSSRVEACPARSISKPTAPTSRCEASRSTMTRGSRWTAATSRSISPGIRG